MNPTPTFRIETLGCRVNQYDEEMLRREFVRHGFVEASEAQAAEVCVVNTCTVTAEADRKSRQLIRRMLQAAPHARVIATGCAVGNKVALEALDPRVLRVSNRDKERLVDLVREQGEQVPPSLPPQSEPAAAAPFPSSLPTPDRGGEQALAQGRARALLKVQDGCNQFCTFCIVPFVRGRSRSKPPQAVMAEARELVAAGHHELVVTGVHVGAYGRDLDQAQACSLESLLDLLLTESGASRIRLSSIEPADFPLPVLTRMGETGICRHLHLALQHMADPLLDRMRRGHDAAHARRIVEAFFHRHPDGALTGDLLVGFPGETQTNFETLLRFVEEVPLAHMHVFGYSPRPGTPAARMADAVAPERIEERKQQLLEVVRRKSHRYAQSFVGQRVRVLLETPPEQAWARGYAVGTTDNYLTVEVRLPASPVGQACSGAVSGVDVLPAVGNRPDHGNQRDVGNQQGLEGNRIILRRGAPLWVRITGCKDHLAQGLVEE